VHLFYYWFFFLLYSWFWRVGFPWRYWVLAFLLSDLSICVVLDPGLGFVRKRVVFSFLFISIFFFLPFVLFRSISSQLGVHV